MTFLRKLLTVALTILSMASSYQLNAMEPEGKLPSVGVAKIGSEQWMQNLMEKNRKEVQQRKQEYEKKMQAYEEKALQCIQGPLKTHMNLPWVGNCPDLPLDVVKGISSNAYDQMIIELSHNLKASREEFQEILTLIKCLYNTYGFDLSVQILTMSLAQAHMSLMDFRYENSFCNKNLLDQISHNEDDLACLKIILTAAGNDQAYKLLTRTDGFGDQSILHRFVFFGEANFVKVMLDAVGDRVQDLLNHKDRNRTALEHAKYTKDTSNIDPDKMDATIRLLESYQQRLYTKK